MIQIREMLAGDAETVSALYADSWRRTYGDLYEDKVLDQQVAKRFSAEKQASEAEDAEIITLVVTDNEEVIGASLSMMDNRNQAWIDRMHILPAHFGTGLADDLMRATLAKHTGLHSIALKVLKGNDRAVGFYEKHGFAVTDTIESDEAVGGADAIVMTRTISRG